MAFLSRFTVTLTIACAGISAAVAGPILDVAPNACPTQAAACSTTTDKSPSISWNDLLAPAQQWTLVAASLSATAEFDVTTYRAYIGEHPRCGPRCGGAELRILYTPGADPIHPCQP